MNFWTQSKENIYVAAHRGWSELYPENTIPAFKAALDIGVDQLETDVRVTKDGELVLMHDKTVDRTTNKTGLVCDYTLSELREMDAGGWKGEQFRGTKIPTFVEFMELVKDHPTITLNVELKEYPTEGWEETAYDVCDRVLKIIDNYGFTDRVVINTWHNKLNEYIYTKYNGKYRQHVYYPTTVMHGELSIDPYSYGYSVCMFSKDGVPGNRGMAGRDECTAMEKVCRPWAPTAVKNEHWVKAVVENGCELITCNNPDHILALLREMNKHK